MIYVLFETIFEFPNATSYALGWGSGKSSCQSTSTMLHCWEPGRLMLLVTFMRLLVAPEQDTKCPGLPCFWWQRQWKQNGESMCISKLQWDDGCIHKYHNAPPRNVPLHRLRK